MDDNLGKSRGVYVKFHVVKNGVAANNRVRTPERRTDAGKWYRL